MSDKQKVIFKQLQLAGLGIVLLIFGLLAHHRPITFIGIGVFIFGIIRMVILKKFIDQIEEDE